ncbi:MAG: hypothetical protein QM730_11035 [Anaerolineales bacterium]
MSTPVYKMFKARMREAWYQLSKEQQEVLETKMDEMVAKLGIQRVVVCNSNWYSEQWTFWGVEVFPSIEVVQEYANFLDQLDWFRFCESEMMLGTHVPMSQPANPA